MKHARRNITVLFLLSAVIFNSCAKKDPEGEVPSASKGIEVRLTSPVRTKMTETINLNATTSFQNQEIVRATFAGFIVKGYKNPGDHISKGDLLFLMRTKESSAGDTVNINFGNGEFSGLVKVYSRTDGILTELDFQAGNYVSEGDKLAVIVEPRSLKIMLNVPFRYAALISNSALYDFQLPDGRIYHARVIKKIPSIDPVNQTQTFILEPVPLVDVPANLNLIVKMPIKNSDNAFALPRSSIVSDETQTEFWTMKVLNDTLAVRVVVKKGIETDSLVQIIQPAFNLSDRFIADGVYGLPDTTKIIIAGKH
ncbi:MAG: efflux RND transporter periplasmic adaptor subunit [Ignavibacteriales bacterium]